VGTGSREENASKETLAQRRRIPADQPEVDDVAVLRAGRRGRSTPGALVADEFETTPQFDIALLHLVAQFAALEFCQRRPRKMTPRPVQPLFQIEDVAVQSVEVDHISAGSPSLPGEGSTSIILIR
jgi:hypothetical protein